MTIHGFPTNPKLANHQLLMALATYIQEYFPNLDVWYAKQYTPDESSKAAQIPVQSNSGHLGIGKKPSKQSTKKSYQPRATRVLMKVYNVGSNDWIFFIDEPRLTKAGAKNISNSIGYNFQQCNLGLLEDFFNRNINVIKEIQKL